MSKTAGGGLIWARPEPGSRRPRFSREQIAATALGIADAEGFEAVSMRRVAADLGAGTMTLYNYVRTKDELVALMHDAIMGEVLVPEGELPTGWRGALTVIARRARAVMMRHPWAPASLQEAQFGPNAMRRFEQYLAAVADAGLDAAATFEVLTIINSYIFGNALLTAESRKRARIAGADPQAAAEMVEYGTALLASGEFPRMAAMFANAGAGAAGQEGDETPAGPPLEDQNLEEQFERGLQALLDGLALRMKLPDPPG